MKSKTFSQYQSVMTIAGIPQSQRLTEEQWTEQNARASEKKPVEMVECDCGHSCPRPHQMSASLGTSCPDCYDRMSN